MPFGGWLVGPILSLPPHAAGGLGDRLRSWVEHLQLKPRRWRVAACGSGSGGVSTFGHPDTQVAGDGVSIGAAAGLWWLFAEIPAQLTPETCASPVGTVTKPWSSRKLIYSSRIIGASRQRPCSWAASVGGQTSPLTCSPMCSHYRLMGIRARTAKMRHLGKEGKRQSGARLPRLPRSSASS